MTRPVILLPEAQAEFDQAVDWYEQQKPGLGADLLAAVRDILKGISATPDLHAVVHKNVRMAIVPRFPYAIFYRAEPGQVIVTSVFHTSRDPAIWRGRV